ncbi:protein kinase [Heliobacterium undosum]|uniref:Protein kinase n=1 Tax=Heliomicrobium undosum TaxID=121734 RepID=A0A845L463_9FIRM|nr:serine/threonine-protein kinase [Heliomicrobium undosum]MZP29825.1 protein kinase [Heliomicrobium undosum]
MEAADSLCLGCFANNGGRSPCPHCGWAQGTPAGSPLHLSPGTMLNDRYLLGKVLGHGGFGVTYLAWDLMLKVKLAIKEYLPRELATRAPGHTAVTIFSSERGFSFEKGLESFLDEARRLARFREHPNIVGIQDFFRANNTAYLVMNYIEGITFREYLERAGGKLPFSAALEIMMPVMDALREVHDNGILHRDISPDNIYISTTGQVKILDFGAARNVLGECSQSLSVVLKPGYAPEEQYRTRGEQGPVPYSARRRWCS